ncbi:MAG: hypothetical protein ACLRL6_03215 [Clostridium sp.]
MKLRLFIMFALFPFLHATSYSAKLVSCSQDQIVLKSQDSEFRVSLFNTKITKEEGWQKTCELLEDATSIRFEIDPSSKIEEPVPVYLFADDKLVQEELMKQGHAYPMIRNPEYTYEKRLESAYDATQTMAKPAEVKTKSRPALVGPLIWCCFTALPPMLLPRRKSSGLGKNRRYRGRLFYAFTFTDVRFYIIMREESEEIVHGCYHLFTLYLPGYFFGDNTAAGDTADCSFHRHSFFHSYLVCQTQGA